MAHQNLSAKTVLSDLKLSLKTQDSVFPEKLDLLFSVWHRNKRPSFQSAIFLTRSESRDSKMKDAIVGEKWNSTTFSNLAKNKLFHRR